MQQLAPRPSIRPERQHAEREQRPDDSETPTDDESDPGEGRPDDHRVDDDARDRTIEQHGQAHPIEPVATITQLEKDGQTDEEVDEREHPGQDPQHRKSLRWGDGVDDRQRSLRCAALEYLGHDGTSHDAWTVRSSRLGAPSTCATTS